jgi:hypothetical protein
MMPLVLILALTLFNAPQQAAETMKPITPVTHASNIFEFKIAAPLGRVAPLFGPEGERCWAGKHWDPQFLYPQPARDMEGAVFTVQHGPHNSIWVNTVFDLAGGRMQYVAVIPEVVASVIEVRLTTVDGGHTAVAVTYTRTALTAGANDDVSAMGEDDRNNGPHWQQAVEACLAVQPGETR